MDQRAFADVGVPACKTITTTSNKRKTKKVALRHVSWSQVLAEAVLQKGFSGVADPEQAWILGG